MGLSCLNSLSASRDKHLISPYNITTWSNIQVMRIEEMITKDKMSWCLSKVSQLVYMENSQENMHVNLGFKGLAVLPFKAQNNDQQMITKDKMSWCLSKVSQLLYMENSQENMHVNLGFKGLTVLPFKAQIMISIKFLLVISVHYNTYRSWELRKWLPKMNCLDVFTSSPDEYSMKCMETCKEYLYNDAVG